ncbi:CobW family GTP-binding protein [Desulfitobacterium chlororespirans]|uniref:GTPase, G3E family n=1 Tax=Desulfitobacterium chlororespirans DSM 11544 TaxID=1121395 RepID=A0A1M7TH64_9FIRM|nr:CobW family GTP-binding protein [Desulfitobacterium chlororespirans]SHN70050.1 GTPase, G3E family [Desulfitobacterium chlororespirans DSM 11544]
MGTEIYIISGFLGVGKTTLIQKMLKEAFQGEKVVLIENDFGEISVDAALLKSGGVEVKEISAGCICCSLSGDFVKALKDLLLRFHPDKIIIEPSGVGKLSDVMKACSDPRIVLNAKVQGKITVVDVKRCQMHLDNFGEFFEDQIRNADVVVFSRTESFPSKIGDGEKIIKKLNPHGRVLTKPWSQINTAELLNPRSHKSTGRCCHGHNDNNHDGDHHHDHHHHHHHHRHDHAADCGHPEGCEHNSRAEDVFDTVTIRTKRVFDTEDLKAKVVKMENSAKGTILRAKGIVRGSKGYLNLQYLPGDIRITGCQARGDMLCIIGRNLNRQELCAIFSGE